MNQRIMDEYAFFDADRPKEQQKHDIGCDMGRSVIYQTEVDCAGSKVTDNEYMQLMQSLNLKRSEPCIHVLQAVDMQMILCTFLLKEVLVWVRHK